MFEIKNNKYKDQSTDDSTHYLGINALNLQDIYDTYELISNRTNEKEEGKMVTVEYHVLVMPKTLTENPLQIIKSLSNVQSI